MLLDAFPGPSGIVDSTELRQDLAGLITLNSDGTPRPGIFYRGAGGTIGAARSGDMKIDVKAFNAALVRGGGPLFTQNNGTVQSPALTIPSSNQIIHVVYAMQHEQASPYADADNAPTIGFASSDQGATPDVNQAIGRLPAGALPLVSVQVPSTATTTASAGVVIKDIAPFTAMNGGVVHFRLLSDLKAWAPRDGQLAYALDSGNLWIYEAGAPTPGWYHSSGKPDIVTGVYTGGTFSSVVYSAGPTAPYAVNQGGRTYLEGSIVSGSATFTAGVVYSVGTISGPVAPSTTTVRFTTSNISAVAEVTITSAGVITIRLNVTFTGALNLTFTPAVSWITKGLV